MINTEPDRQQIVNQLTAIGLILFEIMEGIEERFPSVAKKLQEASSNIIYLIQELVIEEYLENSIILSTPKLEVDCSYHLTQELEDINLLTTYIADIKDTLFGVNRSLCESAENDLKLANIEMVQAIRPTRKSEMAIKPPWEYLQETLSNHR